MAHMPHVAGPQHPRQWVLLPAIALVGQQLQSHCCCSPGLLGAWKEPATDHLLFVLRKNSQAGEEDGFRKLDSQLESKSGEAMRSLEVLLCHLLTLCL